LADVEDTTHRRSGAVRPVVYDTDNVNAGNQRERLDGYIAGTSTEKEASQSPSSATARVASGFSSLPEFHVSQNGDRAQVLQLIRDRFGCGYIKANSKRDRALVLVVRERWALLGCVIPFFERVPLLSAKCADFEKFAVIVKQMALGHHRTLAGFGELLEIALSMNGGGRFRQVSWYELVAAQNRGATSPFLPSA
jgi:hypothetical protein